ncbi:glycosyltransferase [Pyrus ussuriensis x Pyrus communis]|uniref:Glycosyltransferase n=1 Tax=Pyrus ussuriensis x Pyrus communis TaxID=2448454 RepID=A0A5N5GX54_9ROSA|nr:glycosyltransferase [Pyrus ussuriensis x Pyrus communis]
MGCTFQFPKLCNIESRSRRWLLLLGVLSVTYLAFQSLLLPYGIALRSLLPQSKDTLQVKGSVLAVHSSAKSMMVRNPLTVNTSDSIDVSMFGGEIRQGTEPTGKDVYKEIDLIDVDRNVDDDFPSENVVVINESLALVSIKNRENVTVLDKADETRYGFHLEKIVLPNSEITSVGASKENSTVTAKKFDTAFPSSPVILPAVNLLENRSTSVGSISLKRVVVASKNGLVMARPGKKKMKSDLPPKSITSISEMNRILVRKRVSSDSPKPRWPSVRDQEILAAKSRIERPPIAINDPELYAPLFRNVSMFKRSYELMERTLKIYIYKEGKKPIFHQPILKGLYASEGWFMKLMKGYKRFLVKDPRKAHLFYMPFSSRMLEYALYVRNSHNRANLRQFLKEYSETIAAKYPYFNRTGGADHFLVACHDWAPYETRHHMELCIKALCNADLTSGFKIGRDVSLPETYVRSARNPLRDLGGKPPSRREILAFYAGNMHGYLRPILLEHWKDKDPDMKIFGPMPPGVASKMNYIHHMQDSKYCICPKGFEVNSPRVVEAIFYECVPVIISDNFVPPFFEVLDWGAFSVILAEKDIPKLKEILVSIPEEKYLQLQLGVRKIQKHFLWHPKPLKYDLFHMTLHSIWYNRVFQIKLRTVHSAMTYLHAEKFFKVLGTRPETLGIIIFLVVNSGFKELMGDVFFENEISEMPVTVYDVTVRNTSFLFDSLGFYSSMDDIFTHLLTLASYISRRFVQFIKNLTRRDADRYSDDLLVNSAGQLLRSLRHGVCNSFSEGCSSSSKPCTSGQNPGICERASEPREDTRSEIVASNSSYVVVPFIFKGLIDDIGGLQRTHGMPGVEDGTARFLELLAGIRNGEHKLPSSFVYLLIPGLFSNRGPLYFVGMKKFFSKMGLACHIAKIHSEARLLTKKPVGSWSSMCKLIKGDIRALEDLTYKKRKESIMKHELPAEQIPLISFHPEASIAPGVLATMTHIAHAELSWLPLPNFGNKESDEIIQAGHQLPVVIPLSAAMAVTALHLQLWYGEKSDGLVTCRDAEVPGSVVVRPDRKLDHVWMIYSTKKKSPGDVPKCLRGNDVRLTSSQRQPRSKKI